MVLEARAIFTRWSGWLAILPDSKSKRVSSFLPPGGPGLVIVGALLLICACQSSSDHDERATKFCDTFDIEYASARQAIEKARWESYFSGETGALDTLRQSWSAMLRTTRSAQRARDLATQVTDTSLVTRLRTIGWRITREEIESELQPTAIVDSLLLAENPPTRADTAFTEGLYDTTVAGPGRQAHKRRQDLFLAKYQPDSRFTIWLPRIIRLYNQRVRELGYNTLVDLNLAASQITREDLGALIQRVDSVSLPSYLAILQKVKEELGASQLTAVDLDFYRRRHDLQDVANWKCLRSRAVQSAIELLKLAGAKPEADPLYLDTTSQLRIDYALTISPHPPLDVRLAPGFSVGQVGYDYWLDLAGAVGEATYYLRTSRAPFALRLSSDPLRRALVSRLFIEMAQSRELLNQTFGPIFADWESVVRRYHERELIELRMRLALLEFELEVFDNPNRDLGELYWSAYQKYLLITPELSAEPPGIASELLRNPGSQYCWLYSELITAQVVSHALREFGALADNQSFGAFVVDVFCRPDARHTWSDILLQGVGERLSPVYYLERFTSTTESSGASDPAKF